MYTDRLMSKKLNLVIACIGYKMRTDIDAITQEARSHYEEYMKSGLFNIKFASIELSEQKSEVYDTQHDVYYWGKGFGDSFAKHDIDIIHLFCDSLDGYYILEQNIQGCAANVVLTLTGIPQFERYDIGYFTHLQHAIDVGNLTLFVQSSKSKSLLESRGLFSRIVRPKIKITKQNFTKKKHVQFTIGFASAPFSMDDWEGRGVNLLLDVASSLSEYHFKLAWREHNYNDICDAIKERNIQNISVHNGHINMIDFYGDVDVMIAPFVTLGNNHSSPFSILEGLTLGIPSLVTNMTGITDLFSNGRIGLVADCSVEDISKKLQMIESNYEYFQHNATVELKNILGSYSNDYIAVYADLQYKFPCPTLKEWDNALQQDGKYLVTGIEGMRSYYSDSRIAEEYDETRFTENPIKMYDMLEREAINLIIRQNFKRYGELTLLDIASGDGRILRELVQYGDVTAVENSLFMISVSARKLKTSNKMSYIKENFFEFHSDSTYDVITAFRFIRHFNYTERQKIYKKIHNMLNDNGVFIADFPDKEIESQLRDKEWFKYNVYDVFWTKQELIHELADNNLELVRSIDIGEYLLSKNEVNNIELPLSRVAAFKKV